MQVLESRHSNHICWLSYSLPAGNGAHPRTLCWSYVEAVVALKLLRASHTNRGSMTGSPLTSSGLRYGPVLLGAIIQQQHTDAVDILFCGQFSGF